MKPGSCEESRLVGAPLPVAAGRPCPSSLVQRAANIASPTSRSFLNFMARFSMSLSLTCSSSAGFSPMRDEAFWACATRSLTVRQMTRKKAKLRTINLVCFMVCLPYLDLARTRNQSVQQVGRYFILWEACLKDRSLVRLLIFESRRQARRFRHFQKYLHGGGGSQAVGKVTLRPLLFVLGEILNELVTQLREVSEVIMENMKEMQAG